MAKKLVTKEQIQKRKFWKQHLEQCGRSGISQAEYCRQHKLSTKSFTYWKRRFRDISILRPVSRQKTSVTFVPVQVKPERQIAGDISSGLVLCKDGYRIEIREGFKTETLGEVLRTIRELSC